MHKLIRCKAHLMLTTRALEPARDSVSESRFCEKCPADVQFRQVDVCRPPLAAV